MLVGMYRSTLFTSVVTKASVQRDVLHNWDSPELVVPTPRSHSESKAAFKLNQLGAKTGHAAFSQAFDRFILDGVAKAALSAGRTRFQALD